MPNQEDATNKVTQANNLYAEGYKLAQSVKKKNNAIETVKAAEAAWIPIVNEKTPVQRTEYGGININVHQYKLLLDTKRFRNSIQTALNSQLHVGGVKAILGPRVPGVTDQDEPNSVLANYYNYPAVPFPVVIHDLGQVQVQGTYEQIMKNVRSWENFPHYLAVAHGLQLQGTAPTLTGTYNLSIVAYIRYDGMFGPVPGTTAGGTAGGGPAGGGFGGPAGPGGPGGPTSAPGGGIPGPTLGGATSVGGGR